MLPKDDPDFKRIVDNTLDELSRTGELDRMKRRWLAEPIMPFGRKLPGFVAP